MKAEYSTEPICTGPRLDLLEGMSSAEARAVVVNRADLIVAALRRELRTCNPKSDDGKRRIASIKTEIDTAKAKKRDWLRQLRERTGGQ